MLPSGATFQSTLPRGSDASFFTRLSWRVIISIHAPSRERPLSRSLILMFSLFQSTLPRGSDLQQALVEQQAAISIHAPSRERRMLARSNSATPAFQSTLPRGSDCYTLVDINLTCRISIHAPSRERRLNAAGFTSPYYIFQSTLPRGSDHENLPGLFGH